MLLLLQAIHSPPVWFLSAWGVQVGTGTDRAIGHGLTPLQRCLNEALLQTAAPCCCSLLLLPARPQSCCTL